MFCVPMRDESEKVFGINNFRLLSALYATIITFTTLICNLCYDIEVFFSYKIVEPPLGDQSDI